MEFQVSGLVFSSRFDSGNLYRIEEVLSNGENHMSFLGRCNALTNNQGCGNISIYNTKVDYEFKVWTRSDCMNTPFENGNRTWFHFSVHGYEPGKIIRITLMNLNKQSKIYSQGYTILHKVCDSIEQTSKWQRIRDRPAWMLVDGQFLLTFVHRFTDVKEATKTYFAFSYPWSYTETQQQLNRLENKLSVAIGSPIIRRVPSDPPRANKTLKDLVYFHRELLCYSLGGRRIDLLTISDWSGRLEKREDYFDPLLFPDRTKSRPWMFQNKKVIFLTARVHPGETPSSHVFNGILEFLLRPDDARACELRKRYVFKMIPLLNPDGVFLGHYRTDSRGVNLNRVYLAPDFLYHPSVYAVKALLVYHHTGYGTTKKYAPFLYELWKVMLRNYQAAIVVPNQTSDESNNPAASLEKPICVNDEPQPKPSFKLKDPTTGPQNNQCTNSPDHQSVGPSSQVVSDKKNHVVLVKSRSDPNLFSNSHTTMHTAECNRNGTIPLERKIETPEEKRGNNEIESKPIESREKSTKAINTAPVSKNENTTMLKSNLYRRAHRLVHGNLYRINSKNADSSTTTDNSDRKMAKSKTTALSKLLKSHRARSTKGERLPVLFSKWVTPLHLALTNRKSTSKDSEVAELFCVDTGLHGDDETQVRKETSHAKVKVNKGKRFMAAANTADMNDVNISPNTLQNERLSKTPVHISQTQEVHQVVAEELHQQVFCVSPGNEASEDEFDTNLCNQVQPINDSKSEDISVNPQYAALCEHVRKFMKHQLRPIAPGCRITTEQMLEQLEQLRRSEHLADPALVQLSKSSNVDLYIDLHGHCSKRGCFLYGNCLPSEEEMVDNVLYAVLIGVNSPFFDFNGCNFTLRNMYQRDRKGTMTKEGSGRVAIWKHLGLVHSYTLECNYNSGPLFSRLHRIIGTAPLEDSGRLTPPNSLFGPHWTDIAGSSSCLALQTAPNSGATPSTANTQQALYFAQKFTPAHLESVGRAVAVAFLDLRQINPWPRLSTLAGPNALPGIGYSFFSVTLSEFGSMKALRDWTRKYVRGFVTFNSGYSGTQTLQNGTCESTLEVKRSAEIKPSQKSTHKGAASAPMESMKEDKTGVKTKDKVASPHMNNQADSCSKQHSKSDGELLKKARVDNPTHSAGGSRSPDVPVSSCTPENSIGCEESSSTEDVSNQGTNRQKKSKHKNNKHHCWNTNRSNKNSSRITTRNKISSVSKKKKNSSKTANTKFRGTISKSRPFPKSQLPKKPAYQPMENSNYQRLKPPTATLPQPDASSDVPHLHQCSTNNHLPSVFDRTYNRSEYFGQAQRARTACVASLSNSASIQPHKMRWNQSGKDLVAFQPSGTQSQQKLISLPPPFKGNHHLTKRTLSALPVIFSNQTSRRLQIHSLSNSSGQSGCKTRLSNLPKSIGTRPVGTCNSRTMNNIRISSASSLKTHIREINTTLSRIATQYDCQ